MGLEPTVSREGYRRLRLIRAFEEKLEELVLLGKLGAFMHLYSGQEAIAAGVSMHLGSGDWVTSTHRGHGHCLAMGLDPAAMMAEIFGRATGTSKGKGGELHIADLSKGMLGTNGLVGAGIPLATGAALACKLRGQDGVAVSFFGDGAANQGAFHESLNIAAVWNLPAVYVIENNCYGEFTPYRFVTSVADIARRADSYDMRSAIVDGNDFFEVFDKVGDAIGRARAGEGPALLECKTYRYSGHFIGDPLHYRPAGELSEWKEKRDPIQRFVARLEEDGSVTSDELEAIDREIEELLTDAVEFAQSSPWPSTETLIEDVYA